MFNAGNHEKCFGYPDILGFNTGAYSGVIAALSLGYTSFSSNVVAAVLGGGGTITAVTVLILAFLKGTSGGV